MNRVCMFAICACLSFPLCGCSVLREITTTDESWGAFLETRTQMGDNGLKIRCEPWAYSAYWHLRGVYEQYLLDERNLRLLLVEIPALDRTDDMSGHHAIVWDKKSDWCYIGTRDVPQWKELAAKGWLVLAWKKRPCDEWIEGSGVK